MAAILSVCYARIPAEAPKASAAFAVTQLGLQQAGMVDEAVLVRADRHAHSLAYFPRGTGDETLGIELADTTALDAFGRALATAGFSCRPATATACRQRKIRAGLLTRDASGNAIDLVVGPNHAARRFFPGRDSGITGLQGAALRSVEIDRDTLFWTILGATVSDRVGDITYLAIDSLHHRIVLHPADRAGILYLSCAVESLDHVMQNQHFLDDHQIRILQGPGRSPVSGAMFLYVQGPDGMIYGYAHGTAEIDPRNRRPRQFAAENASLCSWGSVCDSVPELSFRDPPVNAPCPGAGRIEP